MTHEHAGTGLQLYSTVKQEGILELSLADVPTPEPRMTKWSCASRRPRSTHRISACSWACQYEHHPSVRYGGSSSGHGAYSPAADAGRCRSGGPADARGQ